MKTTISALALALAPGVAAPANAQDYRSGHRQAHYDYDHPYVERSDRQLDRLHYLMRDGVRSGAIDRHEDRQLFSEFRFLERLRVRYIRTRGGMSDWEARDLRERVRELRFEVRDALWDGRGYGRSWNDREF
jgi:hypothetical protein